MITQDTQADLYRYSKKTDIKSFIKFWRHPGFRFIYCFRRYKSAKKYTPEWFIFKFLHRRYFIKYGIQIPVQVEIGMGLMLPHFGSIVMNSNSKVGKNCNILQNVTLGNTKRGNKSGAPTIGDCVYIGPSATVVGGITIGDNVLIAANTFVNFDVPSNSIVIGNPAKIIPKENATEGYINNIFKIDINN